MKGSGSDVTRIVTDNFHDTIFGRNVSRITISNIHFTRNKVHMFIIKEL